MDIEYVNKMLETLKKKKRRINVLENKKGRHESLNEINKYEIYDEILKWLNEREK
jgi:alpha/beta hydrolase family protein